MLALLDPLSESVGESRLRLLLRVQGFRPRSQVRIRRVNGSVVARVDILIGACAVVEFDVRVKYSGQGQDVLWRENAARTSCASWATRSCA